jgi:hypothetical protein
MTAEKTEIEILESVRLGTEDYDFKNAKKVGAGDIFEIKSKIDGKTYAAKRLQFQIGSKFNSSTVQSMTEREMISLKLQNHPMVCQILDIVKNEENFPFIIMEKYNQSLEKII